MLSATKNVNIYGSDLEFSFSASCPRYKDSYERRMDYLLLMYLALTDCKDYLLNFAYIIKETYCDNSDESAISFKPYFKSLPSVSTPLTFTEEEMKELQGSNLYDAVVDVKKSLLDHCILLHQLFAYFIDTAAVPPLIKALPSVFNEHTFSFDRFIWAYQIFWSRALSVSAPWWKNRESQFLQTKHQVEEEFDEDSNSLRR